MNFKRASLLAAAAAMLMSISGVLPVSERIPAIEASAAETALGGTCGKSASWELAGDGTLTISGTGDMYGLNSQAAPSVAVWR